MMLGPDMIIKPLLRGYFGAQYFEVVTNKILKINNKFSMFSLICQEAT